MSNIFDLFKKIEKKADSTPVSFIIAGLGNPGAQYEKTRHNVGFVAIDYIADKLGVRIDRAKFHSLTAEAKIGEVRVLLMKPQTFMNNSGVAIGEAASFYKIPPERVLVLHDEVSFDPGMLRIRRKGSAGGHNGLKSIIAHLSSEDFPRVKIGVGKKPTPEYDLADWVLGKLPKADSELIDSKRESILDAARLIAEGKIDDAMQRYSK
ncbi:MAG: aminoacyl-tRNA hydrolase [Clostridia bacterium]|nr:aminoacyl-tRNA hydrolase [Clostridia bacterium]